MPNTKQATKRLHQNEICRQRNKATRTAMRTAVKKVTEAENGETAQAALPTAMKKIDKAAKKNVIHENTAARMKSRIARSVAAKPS